MKKIISNGGDWVINIRSVRNVLKGENFVYAFPELTENKSIVEKGETIAKTIIESNNLSTKEITNKINLLLASTLAETKRRGSLVNEIKLRSDSVKDLRDFLNRTRNLNIELKAVSLRNSKTAQPVVVELNFKN